MDSDERSREERESDERSREERESDERSREERDFDAGRDADPAIERVRGDLARLGTDSASAPEVPPEVTERVVAALRAERPSHTVSRPRLRGPQLIGLAVGTVAVLAAAVVGALMLARGPESRYPRGPSAEQITAPRPAADLPLPDDEILALTSRPPDYGPLADPRRRASCLTALGFPATVAPLGARPVDMHGTPAVLLLLPGARTDDVVAIVVGAGCDAAHPGLLANATLRRP
jgi:hypothetical protein